MPYLEGDGCAGIAPLFGAVGKAEAREGWGAAGISRGMLLAIRSTESGSRDITDIRRVVSARSVKRGNTRVTLDKESGSRDITDIRRVISV